MRNNNIVVCGLLLGLTSVVAQAEFTDYFALKVPANAVVNVPPSPSAPLLVGLNVGPGPTKMGWNLRLPNPANGGYEWQRSPSSSSFAAEGFSITSFGGGPSVGGWTPATPFNLLDAHVAMEVPAPWFASGADNLANWEQPAVYLKEYFFSYNVNLRRSDMAVGYMDAAGFHWLATTTGLHAADNLSFKVAEDPTETINYGFYLFNGTSGAQQTPFTLQVLGWQGVPEPSTFAMLGVVAVIGSAVGYRRFKSRK